MADASFLPGLVFSWSSPSPRAPRVIFGACQCNSGVMQGHAFFLLFTAAEQGQHALAAVERWSEGHGQAGVLLQGQEKVLFTGEFPSKRIMRPSPFASSVSEIRVDALEHAPFNCRPWLDPTAYAAAAACKSPLDAAAAMQLIVGEWGPAANSIAVDVARGSVSYQQDSACIIFSMSPDALLSTVAADHLPLSFLPVAMAQEEERLRAAAAAAAASKTCSLL